MVPRRGKEVGIWNRLLGRLLSRFSCFVIFACVQVCVEISKGGDSLPNDYNSLLFLGCSAFGP